MSERDSRYSAARRLLRDLNQERALRKNPLLAPYAGESYDRLRVRVLQAVESIDPGFTVRSLSDRRYRRYQILVRCDLNGESHKEVAAALGFSHSRFYVARREAFLLVAEALERTSPQPRVEVASSDALSLRLDYVQLLHEQGRSDAVYCESIRAVREMRGHERELEVWNIAAEAARLLGNIRESLDAVDEMSRIAAMSDRQELRRASALRIAIFETQLQWMQGHISGALERLEQAIADAGSERTMYGRDATLFAILLGYGAEVCIESGAWERAESLVRRGESIIDRSEIPYANAAFQRLRGRIAQERNGDSARTAVQLRDALRLLQQHKHLPEMAMRAVDYGIALGGIDRGEAMKYVDYGLSMAKDVCGYDRYAILFANAAPFLLERSGPDEVLQKIEELKTRPSLSTRAHLFIGIAEADARLARGEFHLAQETGMNLALSLENASLFPAAAKARLIAIEAFARAGSTGKAKLLFKKSTDFLRAYADHNTHRRATRAGQFR